MAKLTQERIHECLNYDPATGVFTWKISPRRNVKAGSIAGGINTDGYSSIWIDNTVYKAHRLAWFYMTGRWPNKYIDHINHIRDDNRWANLREVESYSEQSRNKSFNSRNTSGVTGVSWYARTKRWRAKISYNNIRFELGEFRDFEEACKVRKAAEINFGYHPNHGSKSQNTMLTSGQSAPILQPSSTQEVSNMKTLYISDDGTQFNSEEECAVYEGMADLKDKIYAWAESVYGGKQGQSTAAAKRVMKWEMDREAVLNDLYEFEVHEKTDPESPAVAEAA